MKKPVRSLTSPTLKGSEFYAQLDSEAAYRPSFRPVMFSSRRGQYGFDSRGNEMDHDGWQEEEYEWFYRRRKLILLL